MARRPDLLVGGLAAVAIALAVALTGASSGTTAPADIGAAIVPELGVAASTASESSGGASVLFTSTAGSDAWAFSTLPRAAALPTGERFSRGGDDQQSVIMQNPAGAGWSVVETPLKADGTPVARIDPKWSSMQMTALGGGAMIASASGSDAVLFVREQQGRFRATQPSAALLPNERLADGQRAPLAVLHEDSTIVFLAAVGSSVETVLRVSGGTWTRESIVLPTGVTELKILGISATSESNAWLVAESATRGVLLMRREAGGIWREQPLGEPLFAESATPGAGVSDVAALDGSGSRMGTTPIAVTAVGVWIDGSMTVAGEMRSFTLFYSIPDGEVKQSWCDVPSGPPLCGRPLGLEFSTVHGYRSLAWPGSGFGSRLITNPLGGNAREESNRGTWARLDGEYFQRHPGGFANIVSASMRNAADGWIGTTQRVAASFPASRLTEWSSGVRGPITDIAPEPLSAASLEASALVVGLNGTVSRYQPGSGWSTEFLLSANGFVERPNLRAVAWPRPGRAFAVGEKGAMWVWRSETDLWERDAGAPPGFLDHLTGVAFDPNDPDRGYAVGRAGTILEYGKSWQRVCAQGSSEPNCASESFEGDAPESDIRQIAFAGSRAMAVTSRGLLISDGNGWRYDDDLAALIAPRLPASRVPTMLVSVAGLPDGGAMVAGTGGLAAVKDSANSRWRLVEQPLAHLAVHEIALRRSAGQLQAIASVSPGERFPAVESLPTPDPNSPPPLLPAPEIPSDGYLLRWDGTNWTDVQNAAFGSPETTKDRAAKSDPILGLAAAADGSAWAVGGWTGRRDAFLRGSNVDAQARIAQTSYIGRFKDGAADLVAGNATSTGVEQPTSGVNFVVGGHSVCEQVSCWQSAVGGTGPDRLLDASLALAAKLRSPASNGSRFMLYTGGRAAPGSDVDEGDILSLGTRLASRPELPVFPAVSKQDTVASSATVQTAWSPLQQPAGNAVSSSGITPRGTGSGGRTHYSFDSQGASGRLRVIVIDNSKGSLAASDPHQNPAVASQRDWLRDELRDARVAGLPAVVMGSRDLNHRFEPSLGNRADDALEIARLLRDEGASAYFYERPEEHRVTRIPAGDQDAIPSFGTGTLGYRSEIDQSSTGASAAFGHAGLLAVNVDVAARDAATNRAPVSVKMIPLVSGLSLEAIDGTQLRRSRAALFSGLARKPLGGDRWLPDTQDGASPSGSDPYTVLPVEACRIAGCDTRVQPQYTFSSSDPDIADFVKVDPNSSNLRKPLLDAQQKTISDSSSGLLCAFNAGTTTVSVSSGGLTYSRQITVQPGTVQSPCGTRPLSRDRFASDAQAPGFDPPSGSPPITPTIALTIPALLAAKPRAGLPRLPQPLSLPALTEPGFGPLVVPPPPPPSLARPIPPTGGMSRVYEEKREEEAATEDSQAYALVRLEESPPLVPTIGLLILLAALAGTALPRRGSGRPTPNPVSAQNHGTANEFRRRRR